MKHIFAPLFALMPLAALHAADPPANKPNILFILTDGLGWSDTTLYGATRLCQMPNIERLAKRGIRFTHAYAHPMCTPSRICVRLE